jgi:uncharacterized protein YndB with AHSA1/START domain
MTAQPYVFKMSRLMDAPIDRVWRAWTTPEILGKWFSPKGVKSFLAKLDLRPGGSYHYGLENPDGSKYYGRWMIIDVQPNSKLEFINSFSDENMGITRHPMSPTWPAELHSTILFRAIGEKTEVEVQWKPHNSTEEEIKTFDAAAEGMKGGWGGTFDNFADYLKT